MGKGSESNRLLGAPLGSQDDPSEQAQDHDPFQALRELRELLILEGISLATDQPEFRRGNKGGRSNKGLTEDRLLALLIDDLQTNTTQFKGREVKEIITLMKKANEVLGLSPDLSRLIKAKPRSIAEKVSRGRAKNGKSIQGTVGAPPDYQKLIASVRGAGGEAASKDPRFFNLCSRLGIDAGLPIEDKLMLVRERILDTDQPNVRNANGKKVSGEDLLALIVDDIRSYHPKLKGTPVKEILDFLRSGTAGEWRPWYTSKLFHASDPDSLLQKVSRGRSGSYYTLRRNSLDRMARALFLRLLEAEKLGKVGDK